MKHLFACILLAICLRAPEKPIKESANSPSVSAVKNLFVITIDGFRWQEVFTGADSLLINSEAFSPGSLIME